MDEKIQKLSRAVRAQPDGFMASPRQRGYRARITLSVGQDGTVGYHLPRSKELYEVREDPLAREEINRVLACIEPHGTQRFELRSNGRRVVANIVDHEGSPTLGLPDGELPCALKGRAMVGDPSLDLEIGGIHHRISPGSFYQVNLEVNELLVAEVVKEVLDRQPEAVLDLYSGIGSLSLPIAAQGVPCTLIEREGSSARDARRSVRALGLPVQVLTADANRYEAGSVAFDVVILDPPRAGAAAAMRALLLTRPRLIVYVSCNPRTLGRDLETARKAGYTLVRLTAVDMFPGTEHLEALAVLER